MLAPLSGMRYGLIVSFLAATLGACAAPQPDSRLLRPPEWERVQTRAGFSFLLPLSLAPQNVRGIDSYVGRYASASVILSYDFGQHSSRLSERGERGYTRRAVDIGGKPGHLVRFRLPKGYAAHREGMRYFAGIHVAVAPHSDLGDVVRLDGTSLTMTATCRTVEDCDAMEAVLLSVEFPE